LITASSTTLFRAGTALHRHDPAPSSHCKWTSRLRYQTFLTTKLAVRKDGVAVLNRAMKCEWAQLLPTLPEGKDLCRLESSLEPLVSKQHPPQKDQCNLMMHVEAPPTYLHQGNPGSIPGERVYVWTVIDVGQVSAPGYVVRHLSSGYEELWALCLSPPCEPTSSVPPSDQALVAGQI
jgi:hypothetical protein